MTGVTSVYVVWALILGAVSAVSLPLGSLIGLNVRFPPRYIAIFVAFGAGALIAALSVEVVAPTAFALTEHTDGESSNHAYAHFFAMLAGGILGGVVFVALDAVISAKGGYLRKTSTTLAYLAKRRRDKVQKVMGAVLEVRPFDALPGEMSQILALPNFPEALSSSANMLGAGWSRRRIFLMWLALMVTTAIGAGFGFLLASLLSENWLVFAEGLAARAMLTMIAAAMIPETAAHGNSNEEGLSALAGFLAAVMFRLLEWYGSLPPPRTIPSCRFRGRYT
jgi:ZIP family zinc transporter